ncbi:hypothetical protein CDO73_10780 [Saccharibacillus sp. O23]|uniref:hypothetical protein n=1 Tax=Saccharibacillus sp. O23 TaxID=2009338 RepID=UPI000B4E18E3|nr:hypothetical protein [Saccharibacillus sp. O23]OWR30398.1 hypothetical protein CDO73_10780 [Saccharibacillus sp. O23]
MKIMKNIINLEKKNLLFVCLGIFLIGAVVNFLNPYPLFYVHQIILLLILFLSMTVVKKIFVFFDQSFPSPLKDARLDGFNKNFNSKMYSCIILIISTSVTLIYFISIFCLEYIKINLVGIYALMLGACALYVSIIGYCLLVILIRYLRTIRKDALELVEYERFSPANTDWLIKTSEFFNYLKRNFFILGFLFTLEYAILIPQNAIEFSPNFQINTKNNAAFIMTWTGILLFIVLAFPIISFLSKKYIKEIIASFKQKTILELDKLLIIAEKNNSGTDVLSYVNLINRVNSSPSYPWSASNFRISSLIPLLTISVHLSKIISNFDWKNIGI